MTPTFVVVLAILVIGVYVASKYTNPPYQLPITLTFAVATILWLAIFIWTSVRKH